MVMAVEGVGIAAGATTSERSEALGVTGSDGKVLQAVRVNVGVKAAASALKGVNCKHPSMSWSAQGLGETGGQCRTVGLNSVASAFMA